MADHFEHLNALRLRLSNETDRLRRDRSAKSRSWRHVTIDQVQREIAGEIAFLAKRGIVEAPPEAMSDSELLAELGA